MQASIAWVPTWGCCYDLVGICKHRYTETDKLELKLITDVKPQTVIASAY